MMALRRIGDDAVVLLKSRLSSFPSVDVLLGPVKRAHRSRVAMETKASMTLRRKTVTVITFVTSIH